MKVIVDGIDAAGSPTHNEWAGKIDGKFYPVTGDPTQDERSYRNLSKSTWALAGRMGGKRIVTGTIIVSRNGKSRTVNATVIDAKGRRLLSHAVYDKQ